MKEIPKRDYLLISSDEGVNRLVDVHFKKINTGSTILRRGGTKRTVEEITDDGWLIVDKRRSKWESVVRVDPRKIMKI